MADLEALKIDAASGLEARSEPLSSADAAFADCQAAPGP
ncbi:hypothetical protein RLPCCGM1_p0563 [Rhizobium leguminosarum bv. phaseoli CCGM1]|nr:hypothetical protein RLPCCGM1_p0563 [Rhizobium leguminosarum bv. phaseoli CCGM1]